MKKGKKLSIWQTLAIGYLLILIVGSLLLKLPIATKSGQSTSYVNALFTSASASCLTGLVTYGTKVHWSAFGQIVILILIQLGGLGFMTLLSAMILFAKKKIGVYQSVAVMQSAGEIKMNNLSHLIKRIIIGTIIFELAGTVLLSIRFIPDFKVKGIFYALFHSVSAFCNAGFDLMGSKGAEFVSLTAYAKDPIVVLTHTILIIMGGLGFFVWSDCIDSKFNFKKFQLHTKIVLISTLIVNTSALVLFYFFERNNPTLSDYNFGEKLLVAIFNAVTPRTAGFSVMNVSDMSASSKALTIFLMFTGGCSGSTAGGVKLNTIVILIMSSIAVFRKKQDVEFKNRRIAPNIVLQALAIITAFMVAIFLSVLIVSAIDTSFSLEQVIFEIVSAIGTVGSSYGITPYLSSASKIILIILMYLGRAGILTVALAFGEKTEKNEIKKPIENVLVG